ncbi:hypothetical protein HPG69_008809 [Diceros bicornis minor]|uniref:B30.2/SPRY domain-containing protein n=1 Tax=Diceros bicornis minor TaxID=77932 RepID=A0A7J7FAN3_DICBM|nr:hypothetical protein HPG69_008809 [Diceros bicornis minor]
MMSLKGRPLSEFTSEPLTAETTCVISKMSTSLKSHGGSEGCRLMRMKGYIWSGVNGLVSLVPNTVENCQGRGHDKCASIFGCRWRWPICSRSICDCERQLCGRGVLYHQKSPPQPGKDHQGFHCKLLAEGPALDFGFVGNPACLVACSDGLLPVATAEGERERASRKKSQAYAEWKMIIFQAADVILDPNTANPILLLSDNQRSCGGQMNEGICQPALRSLILSCKSCTSGRHFWEVEVGDRKEWYIGVCKENVEMKKSVSIAPKNGFWTMGLSDGKDYLALTEPWTNLTISNPPQRVEVFLEYKTIQFSFYNAMMDLISTPSHKPPSPGLCGLFSELRHGVSDLFLETPVTLGSADGNGDLQAEVTSLLLPVQPGAEGLLLHSNMSQQ